MYCLRSSSIKWLQGLAVAATFVAVATTTQAKTLLDLTGSQSLSWDVTYAPNSIYNGSGGHAFWNLEANDGVNERWRFFNGLGRFDEGVQVNGDGRHAHLTGQIRKYNLGTNTFFGDTYSVDVRFELLKDLDELLAVGGQPKKELHSSAYVENGGPVDPATWRFYRVDNAADNRVTNLNGGDYYQLTHAPVDFHYEVQVGQGANNKNLDMGMSVWYISKHYDASGNLLGSRQGDINVNLTKNPTLITVPVPGAAWMGLSLLSVIGVIGKVRKNRLNA